MVEKLISVYSSISLSSANQIIDVSFKFRLQNQLLPIAVAVLDSGGNLVAFKREDGCGILRYDIAFAKAWSSLGMGMSTRQIRDRLADRPTFQTSLAVASHGRFIPTPGGVLIVDKYGVAIGAVGISGDTSDKDEFCAIEAVKIAGFIPEPSSPLNNWAESHL